MKKLFLILLVLPNLLNAASAASTEPIPAHQSTEESQMPAAFNTQTLPTIHTLDIKTFLDGIQQFLVKHKLAESERHEENLKANLDFNHLTSSLLQETFIEKLGEKAKSTAMLLAFIVKEFIKHKHEYSNNMTLFNKKPFYLKFHELFSNHEYKLLSLRSCYCIKHYIRIFDIFYTVLAIVEMYREKNLDLLIYSSLASGNLLHDYVILAALIKCGLAIQVNIIDPLYKEDLSRDEMHEMKKLEKNLQDEIKLTGMRNVEATHLRIADFTFKLRNILENYTHATKQTYNPYKITVVPWQSTEQYLQFLEENKVEYIKPHVLTLVDPEPKYERAILEDAAKIEAHFNTDGHLYHLLRIDKTEYDKLFLELILEASNYKIHKTMPLNNY